MEENKSDANGSIDNVKLHEAILKNPEIANILIEQQQQFSGPVPPPSMITGYEKLYPGTAAYFFESAKNEQTFRHEYEKEALSLQKEIIDTKNREIALQESQNKRKASADSRADYFALFVMLAMLILIAVCIVQKQVAIGVALVGVFATAAVFIRNQSKQDKKESNTAEDK